MLKRYSYVFLLIALTKQLTACSPINSIEPFDDKQAAILAKEMYPNAYSKKKARDSMNNSATYESSR
jgi:hypothetical protein